MQVIIIGLKGEFKPVTAWYKKLFNNIDNIMRILENKEEGWPTAKRMLNIFQAGLYSKSDEVALWTCKLLAKMASEFHLIGYSSKIWDWFTVKSTGGLKGVVYCMKKNQSTITQSAITVIFQFGKYNFTDLFTRYLVNLFPKTNDYFRIISTFIQPFSDYKLSRDDIIEAGILEFWIDLACKKAAVEESNKPEDRAAALSLLTEIWIYFPNTVEGKYYYSDQIITLTQRANRDKNESLQFLSLVLLFRLMDVFSSENSPYAPIVYRSLIFALVENHSKINIRQLILNNIALTFENYPDIPLSTLIEPYIKLIRRSEGITFFYNQFDFDFLGSISTHPKLNVKNAIQILDSLTKAYIEDEFFCFSAFDPFVKISNKFKEDETFSAYFVKLLKVSIFIINKMLVCSRCILFKY